MLLGELTPFPGNARRGDVRLILESLRTSGQYRSLIARQTPDSDLVVLAGNHTLQALAEHGRGPAPVGIPSNNIPAFRRRKNGRTFGAWQAEQDARRLARQVTHPRH